MMKDLIIPGPSKDKVDLSQINPEFKGIIIAYKGNKVVGYIQYSNGYWHMFTEIDVESYRDYDEILLELIYTLIKGEICTHFKVIEFEQ